MKELLIFVAGIAALGAILASIGLGHRLHDLPDASAGVPCIEARKNVKAMQACLSNRPQCVIVDGWKGYKVYHDAQEVLLTDVCKNKSQEDVDF